MGWRCKRTIVADRKIGGGGFSNFCPLVHFLPIPTALFSPDLKGSEKCEML